jgi:hypothetical protein
MARLHFAITRDKLILTRLCSVGCSYLALVMSYQSFRHRFVSYPTILHHNCLMRAGRNKLLINHLGRLFVTSDAATIIREVEVVHPAAKLLVMASQAQEAEVCFNSSMTL